MVHYTTVTLSPTVGSFSQRVEIAKVLAGRETDPWRLPNNAVVVQVACGRDGIERVCDAVTQVTGRGVNIERLGPDALVKCRVL